MKTESNLKCVNILRHINNASSTFKTFWRTDFNREREREDLSENFLVNFPFLPRFGIVCVQELADMDALKIVSSNHEGLIDYRDSSFVIAAQDVKVT